MESLIHRYEKKLIDRKLADPGDPVLGELNTEMVWNRDHPNITVLEEIMSGLNINSLLFSAPATPYKSIIDYLAEVTADTITLKDNETRTFLHDIPVVKTFSPLLVIQGLKNRKCVIVKDHGLVTWGTVSPEQTYVNFSSVLFSCFVKFFADYLTAASRGGITPRQRETFENAILFLNPVPQIKPSLMKGPFESETDVYDAISQAGKPVVNYGLVDSVMGNISYRYNHALYISQTGSFLDELEGCIDPCPLDNSSCTGITASSELPTHLEIARNSENNAILHGHPRFSVIMSMFCEQEKTCKFDGECHVKCPEKRYVGNVPIVTGESGTGPTAIVNTVPLAVSRHKAAIVYGHGVFTAGRDDFNTPFSMLCDIERMCREEYFGQLKNYGEFSITKKNSHET
jgi:ribulose-5-phosphate 4-epimerase/fuculose-1-phosphate aldolase